MSKLALRYGQNRYSPPIAEKVSSSDSHVFIEAISPVSLSLPFFWYARQ